MVTPSTAKCQRSPSEVTHGASTSVRRTTVDEREQEGDDAGDEGEPASRARRIPAAGREQPDRDDGGDDEGQGQCHTVTPSDRDEDDADDDGQQPGGGRRAVAPSRRPGPRSRCRDAAPRG